MTALQPQTALAMGDMMGGNMPMGGGMSMGDKKKMPMMSASDKKTMMGMSVTQRKVCMKMCMKMSGKMAMPAKKPMVKKPTGQMPMGGGTSHM